jgi:hypothetical protein
MEAVDWCPDDRSADPLDGGSELVREGGLTNDIDATHRNA